MSRRPASLERRPPPWAGAVAAGAGVAGATALVSALDGSADAASLGVLYLPVVLLVSVTWGVWLGLASAVLSALAFNFFHIPPTGRFTIAGSENWTAFAVFVFSAIVVSAVAERSRRRGAEAEARAAEADLAAELARGMLTGDDVDAVLRSSAKRLADALGVGAAGIVPGVREPREREAAHPLRDATGTQVATLLLPADVAPNARVLAALQALVAALLQREALLGGVVETAALRRSDDLKTALLRAVSHDLRSPLTGIVTAAHALRSPSLEAGELDALSADIVGQGERLERVIANLLDLSRLEAGSAAPRQDWVDVADVLAVAAEDAGGDVRFAVDRELPAIRADAAQLERAFANLVDNAVKHSGGQPVSVRARAVRGRVVVRVVDRGPGIPAAEQARVFEAFYKGRGSAGSGLGLAIVRGFVEANGGVVAVESLPGQGTSFVVELPVPAGVDLDGSHANGP